MEVGADPQITDLAVNDHACLTFGDAEELIDLTAAFISDGLESGFKVLWVGESAAGAESVLADRGLPVISAVASGQMRTLGTEGQVLAHQEFRSDRAIEWLTSQVAVCEAEGFTGLRVALDMGWALRPVNGVAQLTDFEEKAAGVVADNKVIMLCQYDRARFDPVTLASVVPAHTRPVAAATYHADAVLRICRQYAPPGVRLAGEIDYRAAEPLALALAEALRIDTDITMNLRDLSFIDASCARMILDAARSLGGERRMILWCTPVIADLFLRFDALSVPSASVVTVRDH